MRLDGVHRYGQLPGDLPGGQVGLHVTQHPGLAAGEGLDVVCRLAGWRDELSIRASKSAVWQIKAASARARRYLSFPCGCHRPAGEVDVDHGPVRQVSPTAAPACSARKGEPSRPGSQFFKPLRQAIESVNDTSRVQLDLERHCRHTPADVLVRILQRILALTAAIWLNDHIGRPVK